MSFIGAVATSVRQVLAQYAKDVHLPCLIVGAGNFTVPSVLRSARTYPAGRWRRGSGKTARNTSGDCSAQGRRLN